MSPADIAELDRRLSRLHRMCGRRAPSESEVKFWYDELAQYPSADVFDQLARWEREAETDHPPTLKNVKRAVAAKHEAHRQARELRNATAWAPPGPHARAFARMWLALRERAAADPRAWCLGILRDPAAGHEDREFARQVVARLDARPRRVAPAPASFVAAGSVVMPAQETEAEREARLEREAIQAEACR
ncbi:MAG: hypothetical protein AB1651_16915 [Pseudomonadota bacterium]